MTTDHPVEGEAPAVEVPATEEVEATKEVEAVPAAEEAMIEVPVKEKVMQPWDHVPGTSTTAPKAMAVLFVLLGCAALAFVFVAEYTNDFRRNDEFHPTRVALQSRHWSMYTRQFEPAGPATYLFDGTTTTLGEHQRQAACLAYEANEKSIYFPEGDAVFRSNATENGTNGVALYYAEASTMNMDCTYQVPYTAVWAAMAVSFFGFAAVCHYSVSVMSQPRGTDEMSNLAEVIHQAAMEFLHMEYRWLAPFVFLLWIFLFVAIDGQENDWVPASSVSFLIGAALSAGCGYYGMHIATEGNCRTAAACYSNEETGVAAGLQVAFRTGACMGIGVVSCGVFGLTLCYTIFGNTNSLGGFGFGASAVALFARVGGGIYTKAADVGADLCGKVDKDLGEDSPKNPATIADCVGDNVGDVAGMGADLFESFVGSVVAAAVLGAPEFGTKGVALPFYIVMIGLAISIMCTMYIRVNTSGGNVPTLDDLLGAMRVNVLIAGALITVCTLFLCIFLFEDERDWLRDLNKLGANDAERYWRGVPLTNPDTIFDTNSLNNVPFDQQNPGARLFGCIVLGLAVGILIGMVTEYFTSHTDEPTQSIGRATEFGPGPVIIQGLGMGMYSTVVPLLLIVCAVLGAYYLAGFYGTAISCVGMLSTLGVTMSTDAYGPVSDNAGGIAEMSELPSWVRDYTDALDALGNTTAATGKGFANGSAVLSALSILTAFARVADIESVDLLRPVVVVGVLVGSLLPYVFGAMTMLSVNKAAQEMMGEVRRQFKANPLILSDDPDQKPDYSRCIQISTQSSLKEMLMPGVLAIFSPLVMGFIFGSHCLVGLLVGAIASGYLLGVMMSNTGGAWDNAKKWIEAGEFKLDGEVQGKKTDCHKAAVCGDTVGDPFKDTSGPALNILIKLMTRFAFVCAPLFDDSWDLFYIGLILLAVALICVALIHFVVQRPTATEESTSAPDATA